MRRALFVLACGAATAAWWLLPSRSQEPRHRASASRPGGVETIVLVSIDTIRADRMSCYGYEQRTTPRIDEIAATSLFAQAAFSTIPLTLPAHSSMLTGLLPPSHGVHDNLEMRLPDETLTLAEILRANGYSTYGIISSVVLDSAFGLDQGFDVYDDAIGGEGGSIVERPAGATAEAAIEWLSSHAAERKFLFLHFYDPHGPYAAPAPFRDRFSSPYDAEIAYTDHCVGQVVDALRSLGLYDEALVVITGDHGEMLGEHGEDTHSFFVYQSAVRVPLMFRLPGGASPTKLTGPCSIVDVVPTVLAVAGIDAPEPMQGVDLLELAQPGAESDGRSIYSESLTPTKYEANSLLSVIHGDWHYIQTTQPELYNWTEDPAEVHNLIREEPRRATQMQRALQELLDACATSSVDTSVEVDPHTRSSLESLGYVAGAVSTSYSFDQSRRNPAEVLEIHNDLALATHLIGQGELGQAIALCEGIIEADAGIPEAYVRLSACYAKLQRHDEQVEVLETRLLLDPDDIGARKLLASGLVDAGRTDEAELMLRQLMLDDPTSVPVRTALCDIMLGAGRLEEARQLLRQLVGMPGVPSRMVMRLAQLEYGRGGSWRPLIEQAKSLDARDPVPWAHEGEWLAQEGDEAGAERAHRRAVELNSSSAPGLTGLGSLLMTRGELAEAEALLLRAARADPRYAPAWFYLGVVARDRGEADKALESFERAISVDEGHVPSLVNLGSALRHMPARRAEAERHLLRAVELEPRGFVALLNLGALYMSQKDAKRALWAYGRASDVDPTHREPWMQLMVLHRIVGDMNKCLEAARQVLSISSEDPAANMMAALCCEALGRSAEADAHVRAALSADRDRVQVQAILQREPSLAAIVARVR